MNIEYPFENAKFTLIDGELLQENNDSSQSGGNESQVNDFSYRGGISIRPYLVANDKSKSGIEHSEYKNYEDYVVPLSLWMGGSTETYRYAGEPTEKDVNIGVIPNDLFDRLFYSVGQESENGRRKTVRRLRGEK